MKRLAWLLLICFCGLAGLRGQGTEVHGNVSGHWTADDGPYWVTGNITVPWWGSLTIDSEAAVVFKGLYGLHVHGGLHADGLTDSTQVIFTFFNDDSTYTDPPFHHGIKFFSGSYGHLNYCQITKGYAQDPSPQPQWYNSRGGGILIDNADVTVENCYIGDCYISSTGYGGGICILDNSTGTIQHNTISKCGVFAGGKHDVSRGGGIFCQDSDMRILNNKILTCSAVQGGGIHLDGDRSLVFGNYISGCSTPGKSSNFTRGGGLYIRNPSFSHTPVIANNTILANYCHANGSAIFTTSNRSIDIYNCIIWNNTASLPEYRQIEHYGYRPTPRHCNIMDGGEWIPDHGNFDSNPLFAFVSTHVAENPPALRNISPCIDQATAISGAPGVDIRKNPRQVGAGMDVGAAEFQHPRGSILDIHGPYVLDGENMIWDADRINILGDVLITNGGKLTIAAPAYLEFKSHYTFMVDNGSLYCESARDSLGITFSIFDHTGILDDSERYTTKGGWGGLYFVNGSDSVSSRLIGVKLEYAKKNRQYPGSRDDIDCACNPNGGAIYINGYDDLHIERCHIENNVTWAGNGGGIYIENASPRLLLNEINANQAHDYCAYNQHGGGIYVTGRNANPTISYNNIHGNYAYGNGGGIAFNNMTYEFANNRVENNFAFAGGGGVWVNNTDFTAHQDTITLNFTNENGLGGGGILLTNCIDPVIEHCDISHNGAKKNGGGILADFSANRVLIRHCTVNQNTSGSGDDMTSDGQGGGIYSQSPQITIRNSTINQNAAQREGGGIWYDNWQGDITVDSCTVHSNIAGEGDSLMLYGKGGGLYILTDKADIQRNRVIANAAMQSGGGMFYKANQGYVHQNIFSHNAVGDVQDTTSVRGDTGGGGLSIDQGTHTTFISNTVYGNVAFRGGGIRFAEGVTFLNCIVWGNMAQSGSQVILEQNDYKTNFFYSCIQGGINSFAMAPNALNDGTHLYNKDHDPMFNDPGVDDFSLNPSSPCIGTGMPEHYDIPGTSISAQSILGFPPRLDQYDMGAIQYTDPDDPDSGLYFDYSYVHGNYPNPFNPRTILRFHIAKFDADTEVKLRIYNIRGQLVKDFRACYELPGDKEIVWYGDNRYGHPVASGVYLFRMTIGNRNYVHKMMLLK